MKQSNCVWLRHDLRIHDNPALSAACQKGLPVIAVYAVTPKTWQAHDWSPAKIKFVLKYLEQFALALKAQNITFTILQLNTFGDIPAVMLQICQKHQVQSIFINRHYGLDERRCEQQVKKSCGVDWQEFTGNWLLAPDTTLNQQGKPYHVFTAFKRYCLKHLTQQKPAALGDSQAEQQLLNFCQRSVTEYHQQRDFPAEEGTSKLSHYLAQGMLSPKQCIAAMLHTYGTENLSVLLREPGASTWLNELLWREFYQHLMWHYPRLCRGEAFKPQTDLLHWSSDLQLFQSWCNGTTGFPIVDAGMRQLNQISWMHNRLRMITAMFLTKTLFVHWRLGERYFMQHLIDGDFAANNGGWQWCASTGTDAVPYFRIFNPTTQSQRFDPHGHFIRRYCPELSSLSDKDIHCPTALQRKSLGYPEPIVDYAHMRAIVINAFKSLKGMSHE